MSWLEKILAIPAVVIIYLFLIDAVSSNNFFPSSAGEASDMGNALQIGIGQSVGVSVTREYFGGLLRLPIYSGAIGDIGIYHNLFFNYFIYIFAAAMIFWALRENFKINIFSFLRKKSKAAKNKAYKLANVKRNRRQ